MLVHTYYGFTARGGPAGVGEAVGRAVRTSLIVAAFVLVMISLAVYGQSGNFNLAGSTMDSDDEGLHPGWWTLILVVVVRGADRG